MKLQVSIALVTSIFALATMTSAQEPQPDHARPANVSPSRPADEPSPFELANVRVELTVTDSAAPAASQRKTVTMLIAHGHMGRIRAQRPSGNAATLNVDATPRIIGDRVRLQVSLEYAAPLAGPNATRVASVSEVVTVVLEPGKSTVISQSADPSADRKVTVDVTVTILK